MSGTINIKPEQFASTLQKLIKEYGDEAFEICEKSAKSAARLGVSELKKTSPKMRGKYAKGWSHKAVRRGVTSYTEIIYNRTDYQLTHLLEKPHETWNGGRYPKSAAKDHTGEIAKVEAKYGIKFYEGVVSRL